MQISLSKDRSMCPITGEAYTDADDASMNRFLTDLSVELGAIARKLPGARGFHNGLCREDAVQDVILIVTAHLKHGAKLENCGITIKTLADVRKYSIGRLRTNLNTQRKGAENNARNLLKHHDAIHVNTAASRPADEHPMYDEELLSRLLAKLRADTIAYRVAVTVIAGHTIPGTPDFDGCDNAVIARLTGYSIPQVRRARRRIKKLQDELLDD
jgi:hypothetical protein